jgi:hypothetical protein
VSITGYDDHAMEPFITRDGAALFWNSRNAPSALYFHAKVNERFTIMRAARRCS